MTTDDKRQAATAQFTRANAAINTVFDRAEELRVALQGVSAACAGVDVVRAASDVLERSSGLADALAGLRGAADDACAYRSKADIAADLDTRAPLLFPRERSSRPSAAPRPAPSALPPASGEAPVADVA